MENETGRNGSGLSNLVAPVLICATAGLCYSLNVLPENKNIFDTVEYVAPLTLIGAYVGSLMGIAGDCFSRRGNI